jgi:hypothetical protein
VNGTRLAGSWLIGLGAGLIALALARGNFDSLAFPYLVGAAGFLLLMHSPGTSHRFPDTDLERGLDRLFALVLPMRKGTTTTARVALAQRVRLTGLRHGARRWAKELQLITTDGYDTASRISALRAEAGAQDDRLLVTEAVQALTAERARAGADLTLANDPVSMIAYGLGARPAGTDLTALDELLRDLGLSEQGQQLRTHFDDVLAQCNATNLHLRTDSERNMFRDLAGASFVLGASTRILELATLPDPRATAIQVANPS